MCRCHVLNSNRHTPTRAPAEVFTARFHCTGPTARMKPNWNETWLYIQETTAKKQQRVDGGLLRTYGHVKLAWFSDTIWPAQCPKKTLRLLTFHPTFSCFSSPFYPCFPFPQPFVWGSPLSNPPDQKRLFPAQKRRQSHRFHRPGSFQTDVNYHERELNFF